MAMAAVSTSSSWVQSSCCSFINSFTASTSINVKAHFTAGNSLSLANSSTLGGRYGPTRCRDWSGLKSRAKFEKFDGGGAVGKSLLELYSVVSLGVLRWPKRYLLAKEMISRPDAEDLEIIFGNVEDKSESDKGPSFFDQAAGIFSSFNLFLKAISK